MSTTSNHLVSIIVPVFNAEKYIFRCLESLVNQTYKYLEIILVDDGSLDKSGNLCDEFAKKDARIRVIHQENQGVSAARQKGLDTAIGEYVIHADPDDWVEPDWLEILYHEAEQTKADMVMCDFERVYSDKTVYYSQKPTSLKNEDILEDLISERIWGPCWNKLVRRDCFMKYNVCFNPKMNLWEDLYVNCLLLTKGIKVSYVERTLYHYDSFTNNDSIVRFRKDTHIRSAIIFINSLEPMLHDKKYEEAWFFRKRLVKKWILIVPHSKYSIKKTFPEINSIYIEKYSKYPLRSEEGCISFCLHGHEKIGRRFYYFILVLRKMKTFVLK